MGRATSASVAPQRRYQGRTFVKKATVLTPTASEVIATAGTFIVQTSIWSSPSNSPRVPSPPPFEAVMQMAQSITSL